MKLTRFVQIGAVSAVAALTLVGCAANEAPAPAGSAPSADAGATNLSGTLVGGGATSQEVAVQTWTAGLQANNADLTIDYDPAGSGTGRESFAGGGAAFAGSDRAFKIDELESEFKSCVAGSDIIELPTYISPIAIVFNLDGVKSLNLDAQTIAGIFAGTITSWDDKAIADQNPDVTLPALAIAPVHRADKSGTTGNFTDYLAAAAPEVWTHGSVEEWPIQAGEAASGTSGVIASVEGGQGMIGYVDASRAGELGTVAVKVGDSYVPYSPEAAAAIIDASALEEGRAATDLAIKIDRTSAEDGVYPIVLVSYLIGCTEYVNPQDATLVKAFFSYAASEVGQNAAADAAGSAPISADLRAKIDAAIAEIK